MKLSEKLQRSRTARCDEWTMDEFVRDAIQLEDALKDASGGLLYIQKVYGDLPGVGFARAEEKAAIALDEKLRFD